MPKVISIDLPDGEVSRDLLSRLVRQINDRLTQINETALNVSQEDFGKITRLSGSLNKRTNVLVPVPSLIRNAADAIQLRESFEKDLLPVINANQKRIENELALLDQSVQLILKAINR